MSGDIYSILKVLWQIIDWSISELPHTVPEIIYSFSVLSIMANKIIYHLSLLTKARKKIKVQRGKNKIQLQKFGLKICQYFFQWFSQRVIKTMIITQDMETNKEFISYVLQYCSFPFCYCDRSWMGRKCSMKLSFSPFFLYYFIYIIQKFQEPL